VAVEIELKELPKKMPSEEEVRKLEMIKKQFEQEEEEEDYVEQPSPSKRNWTRIFLFCLVGVGLISVAYYLYSRNKSSSSSSGDDELEKKINDIMKISNEDLLKPQEIYPKTPARVEKTPSYQDDISPPIRSPSPASYSPIRSPSPVSYSPENTITKTIHEQLMNKLKKASIAY
jgi:hypothetical protein